MAGTTRSKDFPTTKGSYDEHFDSRGGKTRWGYNSEIFVAKFSPAGKLIWSTIIGGSNSESICGNCSDGFQLVCVPVSVSPSGLAGPPASCEVSPRRTGMVGRLLHLFLRFLEARLCAAHRRVSGIQLPSGKLRHRSRITAFQAGPRFWRGVQSWTHRILQVCEFFRPVRSKIFV